MRRSHRLAVDPADRRAPATAPSTCHPVPAGLTRPSAARRFPILHGRRHGAPAFRPDGPAATCIPGALRRSFTAVAQTLPYDAELVEPYQTGRPAASPAQWAAVTMPTLVIVRHRPRKAPA